MTLSQRTWTVGAAILLPALLLMVPGQARALPLIDLDLGIKGGVNGALLLVEDEFEQPLVRDLFEGDDAFGIGGCGGIYAEARLFDAVGLEVDLLFSRDQWSRTETWTPPLAPSSSYWKLEHSQWANNLRVPVLLKGYLPAGPLRLSLGFGVEWVHTLDHGYEIEELEQANVTVEPGALDKYRGRFTSEALDSTFLVGQLELAIDLVFFTIPIDLRAGYNLSQSDTFEDRFEYTVQGNTITAYRVDAIYTWDFRVLTGFAFSF